MWDTEDMANNCAVVSLAMISLCTMLSYRLQDKWIKKLVSKFHVQIHTFDFLKLKRRQDV